MEYFDYGFITNIVAFCVGFPLTLWIINALHSQVRKDYVAPIYVINLLIADLIQLCCWMILEAPLQNDTINMIVGIFCLSALVVSVFFMVCIALERYLVIAHPQWYCPRRSIKSSVVVSVLVWTLPVAILLPVIFLVFNDVTRLFLGVFFLLPLPLFIFFLGGTLKALSASVSAPSDEKRRNVGILILLLLIYTVLFLPSVILTVAWGKILNDTFIKLSVIFLQLSPLADLILYVFMRKVATDTEGNKQFKQVELYNQLP